MPRITEDIDRSMMNIHGDGTCTATRTFIISGLVGDLLPRRGQKHRDNPALFVRKRRVDRKLSRRGAIFVNVFYG